MKKIILLVLLALVGISASAKKSYITVRAPQENGGAPGVQSSQYFILSGDVPENIEGFSYNSDVHLWTNYLMYDTSTRRFSTGEILTLLSEYGYDVEFVIDSQHFILSKETSSGQTLTEGDVNKDGEVNIADINKIVAIILGIVKENPSILEQIKD